MKRIILASLMLLGCSNRADYFQHDTITGEIVVDFDDSINQSYIQDLGDKLSIRFFPGSSYSLVDKLYVGEYYGNDKSSAVATLQHDSMVEAADENMIYTIPEHNLPVEGIKAIGNDINQEFPNDPKYYLQWGMSQIRLPKTWNKVAGNGV